MTSIGHWTIAPLRSYQGWRNYAASARQIHTILYVVWCALGTLFYLVACFGAVFCVLTFPSMLLGIGLDVAHKHPGVGWFIYAGAVVLLWVTLVIMEFAVVIRQLRARILDIEVMTTVILMLLSFAIAAWYVHYEIAV